MPNEVKIKEVKEKAEDEYKKIDKVLCPYLNRKVHFNAKGLDHIKMKEWNKTRLVSDQYLRLKFLKLASKIVEMSNTLQEFHETKSFERRIINSRWERKLLQVKYYGFVAILNKLRVKIIVKEVEGGQPYFWSIIPFWKHKKDPITKQIKKVFHEGDLERE